MHLTTKHILLLFSLLAIIFILVQSHLLTYLLEKGGNGFSGLKVWKGVKDGTQPSEIMKQSAMQANLETSTPNAAAAASSQRNNAIFTASQQSPLSKCLKGFGTVPDYLSINAQNRIPRLTSLEISPSDFLHNFIERSQPAILTNWPRHKYAGILREWQSDQYLSTKVPNYLVDVEISQSQGRFGYEESSWERTMMPLREFLQKYDQEEGVMYMSHDVWRSERRNGKVPLPDFIYCLHKNGVNQNHEVPHSSEPTSYDDTIISEQLEIAESAQDRKFPFYTEFGIWFSAGGTNSLIHNDPHDNLLLQVDGYKKFFLFPPTVGRYIGEKRKSLARTSSVNLEDELSWDEYPGFREHVWKNRIEVVLTPGDMLFVPAYWFHQVHSSCRNIAVNFWFDTFNMEKMWTKRSAAHMASDDLLLRTFRNRSQCLDVNQNRAFWGKHLGEICKRLAWGKLHQSML